MARWKLMVAHYLNVPDEKWEYKEIDRTTGRERRIQVPVPKHLDPNDPACWTKRWGMKDNAEGEIIVCWEGKGDPGDQIFFGNPTPDMVPVDDEAREVSKGFEGHWAYKPETDFGNFSQSLIDKFQHEMADIKAKPTEVPGLADLAKAMTTLVEQNQKMIEAMTASNRRSV